MSLVKSVRWSIHIPNQDEIAVTKQILASAEFAIKLEKQEPIYWCLEAHLGEISDNTQQKEPERGLSIFLKAKSDSVNVVTESVRFNIMDSSYKTIIKSSSKWNEKWKDVKWKNNETFGVGPIVSETDLYDSPQRYVQKDRKLYFVVDIYYSCQLDDVRNVSGKVISEDPPAKAKIIDDLFTCLIVSSPDLTLKTSDGFKLKVNIGKLSEYSEVFKRIYNNDENLGKREIIIPNFDSTVLMEVLRYIYCGKVQNMETIVVKLYEISKQYEIRDLPEICLTYIVENLTVKNVLSIAQLANINKLDDIFEKCCEIIRLSYKYITYCQFWKELNFSLKDEILCKMAEMSWMEEIEIVETKPSKLHY